MQPMSLSQIPYVRAAVRAARAAGELLAQHAGTSPHFETKRHAADLVTAIDRAAEGRIRRILQAAFPSFGFVGEEQGQRCPDAPSRWIVDPLDGTTNFVHGMPFFGVSIGLEQRGRLLAGVIYDPLRRELFVGVRGRGAFLNGKRLSVSGTRTVAHSLLSTGFSWRFRAQPRTYLQWFRRLESSCHAVRRMGSTALSLAYVAAGRFDGFYERDLWPWDMAAGLLLVEEAGGRVTNLAGGRVVLSEGQLLATNGHIHRHLVSVLAQRRPRRKR